MPPRGTRDILPDEARARWAVVDAARGVFAAYAYGQIMTPTFEETEVFVRGVGVSTDIVRKEMYTFEDAGGRSLTLRPEGTAPVVRAFVEHGMHKLALPVKLWYLAPMFRYEAPQAGRYREHTQLGIEAIGSEDPLLDAEAITVLWDIYRRLGVPEVWFWRNEAIAVFVLRDGERYEEVQHSECLPGLELLLLTSFLGCIPVTQAIRAYRAALRG